MTDKSVIYHEYKKKNRQFRKKSLGQAKVIIATNALCPMLFTKLQGHLMFGSGEVGFLRGFFIIYGHGGHFFHETHTRGINFRSTSQWRLHIKFGFDWPSSFRDV